MRTHRRRWLVVLPVLMVAIFGFSLAAAAVLAEGALHPLLKRRASDTAALAYSIAQAANGTAQKVNIQGRDGVALDGWWLAPKEPNGRAVMVCHGVADSAYGALGYALLFLSHGYSVLVPESRGHGESQGYVTYGVLETDDTIRWLSWMKSHGVNSAFGFGESLGGAILLQSLSHGADFRALVAESAYSSFEAVAAERVARVIPGFAAEILVKEGVFYTYLRYRVNLSDARPDSAILHAHVPILLIHGLADNETSPEHSKHLAEANPAVIRLWLVPGAKHTGAYAAAPQEFEDNVLCWFEQESGKMCRHQSVSEPPPAAEPRLGRRTALTFPLLPPPQKN
jgi:dipeptidyl aminopeptidase/acylaminoacyl peptidase